MAVDEEVAVQARRPAYRIDRSYDWNFRNAPKEIPQLEEGRLAPVPGQWSFCGFPVGSPLGIPAGPLLNADWLLYYAALGFDVLTYKTVRSRPRDCYPPPNLLPVEDTPLTASGGLVQARDGLPQGPQLPSWAVSFGMPSQAPGFWRDDVAKARAGLGPGQVLVVSVVASPEPGWTIRDVAADYVRCARWAAEAGAHVVEANLSCPNVDTVDGQLYREPGQAAIVAGALREALPDTPLVLKIGLLDGPGLAEQFMDQVAPYADGLSTVNCITARVQQGGRSAFGGQRRGIAGRAIKGRSLEQVRQLHRLARDSGWRGQLVGVGGIQDAGDVAAYLKAGAASVQMATAAMRDPEVALKVRARWDVVEQAL